MRWGVRIVAAYGPTIMLYSIPPDQLAAAKSTASEYEVVRGNIALDGRLGNGHSESVRLEGVPIHSVSGGVVNDIAVDTRLGRLKVWLFLRDGEVKTTPKKAVTRLGWLCL